MREAAVTPGVRPSISEAALRLLDRGGACIELGTRGGSRGPVELEREDRPPARHLPRDELPQFLRRRARVKERVADEGEEVVELGRRELDRGRQARVERRDERP